MGVGGYTGLSVCVCQCVCVLASRTNPRPRRPCPPPLPPSAHQAALVTLLLERHRSSSVCVRLDEQGAACGPWQSAMSTAHIVGGVVSPGAHTVSVWVAVPVLGPPMWHSIVPVQVFDVPEVSGVEEGSPLSEATDVGSGSEVREGSAGSEEVGEGAAVDSIGRIEGSVNGGAESTVGRSVGGEGASSGGQ
jgi:hypothetical protein